MTSEVYCQDGYWVEAGDMSAEELLEFERVIVERRRCVDCRVDTSDLGEFYMVNDDVWAAAGIDPEGGMLCIGCLEERLGRELTAADFKDVPLNRRDDSTALGRSARLAARLEAV